MSTDWPRSPFREGVVTPAVSGRPGSPARVDQLTVAGQRRLRTGFAAHGRTRGLRVAGSV